MLMDQLPTRPTALQDLHLSNDQMVSKDYNKQKKTRLLANEKGKRKKEIRQLRKMRSLVLYDLWVVGVVIPLKQCRTNIVRRFRGLSV